MHSPDNRYRPPQTRLDLVQRRRLLHQLVQGRPRKVTTIVAPAGFGKTSLATQWHGALDADAVLRVWVTLGPEDREQGHFLAGLVVGLNLALGRPAAARDVASLSPSQLAGVLATRIRECDKPLWLFLEDYHFAQSDPVEAAVAKLLHETGGAGLHLVISSRTRPRFPVSALRLADEIRQVDGQDLRFSAGEAQEFFAACQARLTSEQIETLIARTDGWAVALQMVRLLLDEHGNGADILADFSRSSEEMGLYLSEQVVSTLPAEVRRFLLATAALPEISADLALAVTGMEAAPEIFFDLDQYALPLVHVDRDRQWLRLHPVFRDYLRAEAARQRLPSAEGLALAARWFAARGNVDAAFRHALLADLPDLAAAILEEAGGWRLVYVSSGEGMGLFRLLMERAPGLDLTLYPLSSLGLAVISAKAGQQEAAGHYLSMVERTHAPGNADIERQARVVRALLCLYSDQRLGSRELSELENDLTLDRHLGMVHRGLLLNLLCANFLDRTELDRALVYGELSIRCLRDSGAHFGAMHLHSHLGQAALFAGNITAAEESYSRLIGEAQAGMGKGSDLDAIGQVLLGELETLRGNAGGARALLDWALPHVERHDTWFDILAAGLMARQWLALTAGDFTAAHAELDAMRRTAQRRNLVRLGHLCDTEQFRLLVASGEVREAARFARRVGIGRQLVHDRKSNTLAANLRGGSPALLWIRLWLAMGRLGEARFALDQLRAMQHERLHVLRQIEIEALEIRLLAAEGQDGQAAERLSDLALAVPIADYRGGLLVEGPAFLSLVARLAARTEVAAIVRERLAGAVRSADPSPKRGAEPAAPAGVDLTGREQAILRLLSTGVTNKDIGRRLELTENTVKFHLKNIFGKLGVNTRTGAIAAARELGLLV